VRELNRFLRHIFAPIVAWLVAKGYLPEYMQGDIVEVLVLSAGFAIPWGVSWLRERL